MAERREEEPYGGEDKISDLPDSILHPILLFIPTLDTVQTCILSKRWRYAWCAIPMLDLD
ncbi:hypothetical protein GIB67_042741 [Kingdonia uniflora]|uniref:F-box domain-containing protein n=1 Tax=Kingdonia uniflora TaxID=39325 RepID=A0A7J7NQQ3_9MAGN|nr:hypothetical protein GIB67_042741 [Kingdonia uniflora]